MRIFITAGPTREPIDPVRYITNRSSGKMGYAIAKAALRNGHEVHLVSGPVDISRPNGVEFTPVESARDMFEAVRDRLDDSFDAAVFCAAVADYRPKTVSDRKIKKDEGSMTIELERTDDILGSTRSVFGYKGVLVGFAAETDNIEANALEKLKRKGCDLLVANDVSRKEIGFDQNDNEVCLYFADGRKEPVPLQAKTGVGELIVERIESLIDSRP